MRLRSFQEIRDEMTLRHIQKILRIGEDIRREKRSAELAFRKFLGSDFFQVLEDILVELKSVEQRPRAKDPESLACRVTPAGRLWNKLTRLERYFEKCESHLEATGDATKRVMKRLNKAKKELEKYEMREQEACETNEFKAIKREMKDKGMY